MFKNKIVQILLVIVALLGGGYAVNDNLGGQSFSTANILNGKDVATTSPTFLSPTATTTYASIETQGASSVDLNLQFNASTTASQLVYIVEFSNDDIDWFPEDIASVSGNVVIHNATATSTAFTYHTWTPAQSGISRKNVTITPIASKYMRIKAVTWVANGSLWGQMILNKEY